MAELKQDLKNQKSQGNTFQPCVVEAVVLFSNESMLMCESSLVLCVASADFFVNLSTSCVFRIIDLSCFCCI